MVRHVLPNVMGPLVVQATVLMGQALLAEAGWRLSPEECMRLFIGKTVRSEAARIEAETGRLLDAAAAEEAEHRAGIVVAAAARGQAWESSATAPTATVSR